MTVIQVTGQYAGVETSNSDGHYEAEVDAADSYGADVAFL